MAPKPKHTTKDNQPDETTPIGAASSTTITPSTDNSKVVTIGEANYDMSNLADVVKLAVTLNTMSDTQVQAYNALLAGGIDTNTIASLIGKGLEAGVKAAVKEILKPDYLAKWRATPFEMGGQVITVADYESRVAAMIARLNAEREAFVTAFPDSRIGEYGLTGGASRARGSKTQHDRNYNLLGAALIANGITEIHNPARDWIWPIRHATINGEPSAEFCYTGMTIGTHKIRNRRKELVDKTSILVHDKWYSIGMLNQANTDLGEFNGWQSGSIETVSAPNTWIVCKVKIGDKLVTLETWYDEHVAVNDESEEDAE